MSKKIVDKVEKKVNTACRRFEDNMFCTAKKKRFQKISCNSIVNMLEWNDEEFTAGIDCKCDSSAVLRSVSIFYRTEHHI